MKFTLKAFGILLLSLLIVLPAYAATYTYDALGRLTSVTYTNGKKINYSYDASGNLLRVTMPDTVAPTVYGTDLVDGAVYVPVDQTVYVTFSEDVQPGANYGGILLKTGETVVDVTYCINGKILTVDPAENLNYSTSYAVYIPAGAVTDTRGNTLAGDYSFIFATMPVP